jgi:hypothetical protein
MDLNSIERVEEMPTILVKQREELYKVIQEDPYNWEARQELAVVLYRMVRENDLTEEESQLEKEKIFREYLSLDPNHTFCRQELASVLQVKVKRSNQIPENERKEIYKELVSLSTLVRFKEELAKILYFEGQGRKRIDNLTEEIIEAVYPLSPEMKDAIKNFFTTDDGDDFKFEREFFIELERFLSMLTKLDPSQSLYKKKLAQCIWIQIQQFKNEEATQLKVYKRFKYDFQRCIALDGDHLDYRESWLELLYSVEEELKEGDLHDESSNQQRIEVYFDFLKDDQGNQYIRNQLDVLLNQLMEDIYEKGSQDLLSDKEFAEQTLKLYGYYIKLYPDSEHYQNLHKYATWKMGRNLKGGTIRQNREAFQLFAEVVRHDSNHFDAQLRMAVLHLAASQWMEAQQLLEQLELEYEEVQSNELQAQFCYAYAVTKARANDIETAKSWMRKGRKLDVQGRFGTELGFVHQQIDICSRLQFYSVSINGDENSYDAKDVNKLIRDYENEPQTKEKRKIILDLRNSSYPVLIGPMGKIPLQAEFRLKILTFLIEDGGAYTNNEINDHCFSLEKTDVDIRMGISNLRESLAKLFCQNPQDRKEIRIQKDFVSTHVLVTIKDKYKWAYQGDTIVRKEE